MVSWMSIILKTKNFMEQEKKEEPKLLAAVAEHIPEDTKGKVDFFIEIALIFILGALIGIAVKTEAAKRITIGFNDYQMKANSSQYNISKLQDDLISKQASVPNGQADQPAIPSGAACGQ